MKKLISIVPAIIMFVIVVIIIAGRVSAQEIVITDLGTLGGGTSSASAINDLGQVVGSSRYSVQPLFQYYTHGFIWQDGVMTDLGTLGGYDSSASDINELGQVTGGSKFIPSQYASDYHAFIWEKGVIRDIGCLYWRSGSGQKINNAGQVIGTHYVTVGYFRGRSGTWAFGKTSGR